MEKPLVSRRLSERYLARVAKKDLPVEYDIYDIAIIVSGDADFIPIINTIRKRFKKKVGNGFFRRTSSYKLRKSCDFSINLNKVLIKVNQNK